MTNTTLPTATFFSSKGTRYNLPPFSSVVADDGSLFWGSGLSPNNYRLDGVNYLVLPNQKVHTETGDTIFWDGSGFDKNDRGFTLKSVDDHHVRVYRIGMTRPESNTAPAQNRSKTYYPHGPRLYFCPSKGR